MVIISRSRKSFTRKSKVTNKVPLAVSVNVTAIILSKGSSERKILTLNVNSTEIRKAELW